MFAKDIMSTPVITVTLDTPLEQVAKLMQGRDIGCVIVVDESGKMRGIITEMDFTSVARCVPFTMELAPVIFGARAATLEELEKIYAMARTLTAKQAMTEKVVSVEEDEEVGTIVRMMLDRRLKHIPVVRDGRPLGVVARHDVLKLMAK